MLATCRNGGVGIADERGRGGVGDNHSWEWIFNGKWIMVERSRGNLKS